MLELELELVLELVLVAVAVLVVTLVLLPVLVACPRLLASFPYHLFRICGPCRSSPRCKCWQH